MSSKDPQSPEFHPELLNDGKRHEIVSSELVERIETERKCPICGETGGKQGIPWSEPARHMARVHGVYANEKLLREGMRRYRGRQAVPQGRGEPRPVSVSLAFEADEKACLVIRTMHPDGIQTQNIDKLLKFLHFTDQLRNELREQ